MTYFPPRCLPAFHIDISRQEKAALDTNLMKSREYNVQNVTVSLRCSYFVSDDGFSVIL